jgi:hypothetical protein
MSQQGADSGLLGNHEGATYRILQQTPTDSPPLTVTE